MAAAYESSSYFNMPGSFHNEGVHPGLIRPPGSPTTTSNSTIFSSAVTPASPSTPSALPRPKHKRRRAAGESGADSSSSYSYFSQRPSNKGTTTGDSRQAPGPGSRRCNGWNEPPSASSRPQPAGARSYVLAGNLDTPGALNGGRGGVYDGEAVGDHGALGESMFSDSDYRTVLGSKRRREQPEADPSAPTTLYALPTHPNLKLGWGSYAFSTLGGVVGKVWDFCWGGAFQGFHAGGGAGYDMQPGQAPEESDPFDRAVPGSWGEDKQDEGLYLPSYPGRFAGEEVLGGRDVLPENLYDPSESLSRASTPPRPAAKRRQTDRVDDLGRNWVVINQPASRPATPSAGRPSLKAPISTPRNRNSGPAVTTGRRISTPSGRRTSGQTPTPSSARKYPRAPSRSGTSMARDQPTEKPRAPSRASYASPRSSPGPSQDGPSTGFSSHGRSAARATPLHQRHASAAEAVSPRPGASRPTHRRTHSNASAASGRISETQPVKLSPRPKSRADLPHAGNEDDMRTQSPRLTEEARRLASKRRMEERDADVRIAAFNRRLQDMIRQGKEALGTTVDVEMEGPRAEGAWEDDE